MARRFAKVSEEEIEEAFFYPSDLVNTKTTIPLRVGEVLFTVFMHLYRIMFIGEKSGARWLMSFD